jgi:pimeloyl-ACP methyl ester carboxylesterase
MLLLLLAQQESGQMLTIRYILLMAFLFAGPGFSRELKPMTVHRGKTDTAFVFVHGFSGDKESFARWPELLQSDEDFGYPDVFQYIFPANMDDGFNFEVLANDLFGRLTDNSLNKYRKLVFITHSAGGILVRKMLTDPDKTGIRDKTMYVVSLAAPFLGSKLADNPLAKIATRYYGSPLVPELSSNPGNKLLPNLDDAWKRLEPEIPLYCAYEGSDTTIPFWYVFTSRLGRVVTRDSATSGCDYTMSIAADHIGISKVGPETRNLIVQLLTKAHQERRFKTVILMDSVAYTPEGETRDSSNSIEIKRFLEHSYLGKRNDFISHPVKPLVWNPELLAGLKPDVILMHWSTFEAKDENCSVSGNTKTSRDNSCQRLISKLTGILGNFSTQIVFYTRTPGACKNISRFFKKFNDNGVMRLKDDEYARLHMIDLPSATNGEQVKGGKYFELEPVQKTTINAINLALNGWDIPLADDTGPVCRVFSP